MTDFAANGVGSDAVVLLYDAREKKVLSINAEPRAPKLATIEWYEKNSGGILDLSAGQPVLVVGADNELRGIVTPFEVL